MCLARPCKTLPPGPLSQHKQPDAAQAGTQTQLTKCPLLLNQVLCEYSPSLVILVFSYHYNSALKRRWETFSGQFRAEISHLYRFLAFPLSTSFCSYKREKWIWQGVKLKKNSRAPTKQHRKVKAMLHGSIESHQRNCIEQARGTMRNHPHRHKPSSFPLVLLCVFLSSCIIFNTLSILYIYMLSYNITFILA